MNGDEIGRTATQVRPLGRPNTVHKLSRAYADERARFYRTCCGESLRDGAALLTTREATCPRCAKASLP